MTRSRALRGGALFQWTSLGVGAVGLVLCALGALADPARAAFSYLAAFAFGISVALGGLVWAMLAHLTGATWFVVLRRIAESVAAALPVFAVLFLPVFLGVELLYPWTEPRHGFGPEVQEWMAQTEAYLNVPAFGARAVLYFAVWIAAAEWLRAWSLRQDAHPSPELSHRLRALSAGALLAVLFTVSFAAVDWLMSLVPFWPSAAWGLYYFAGGLVAALGVIAVLGLALRREGVLGDVLSASHSHALGKLLLATLLLWAYVAYSQYLIVWIADMPREVIWYAPRTRTSWRWVGGVLVAGHVLLPLGALLSWRLKRSLVALAVVGGWIVFMHYVDLYWIVIPALHPAGFLPHWLDLVALLGVGGVAAGFGAWRLRNRPVVPVGDPELGPAQEYTTR